MILKKLKVLAGIITGRPFTGPMQVVVDLTNRCSAGCVMCWDWSPYAQEYTEKRKADGYLDYKKYNKMLADFREMEVGTVHLVGRGDPLLHPEVLKIAEETKRAGFETIITTSGLYFNKEMLDRIIDTGIDKIEFSIHAASAETYRKIHPNLGEPAIEGIKDTIKHISELKKKSSRTKPDIGIVFVVCNLNYKDIEKTVVMAAHTGADFVFIRRLDVAEATKHLLLNDEQVRETKNLLAVARETARKLNIRIETDPFEQYSINGLMTGDYDSAYYAEFPCYVGWAFARVLMDGNIVPCCGSSYYPMGSVYENSLYDIWHSEKYLEFRKKGMSVYGKEGVAKIGKCHACAHFSTNHQIYMALHPFYGLMKSVFGKSGSGG